MLAILLVFMMVFTLIPGTALAGGVGNYPLYPSVGVVTNYTEDGYTFSYEDWSNGSAETKYKTVDLYTVKIPYGTEKLKLNFEEKYIAYAYGSDGGYLYSCADNDSGAYENNGQTGINTAVVTKLSSGQMPDYIHVQTPYDTAWNSDTIFAVNFEYNYTFSAKVNGTALTDITCTPNAYSYTDAMSGSKTTVSVYTITVPAGTQSVDLDFSDNVLAYSYTKRGDYLAGWYEEYKTGGKSASVAIDYGNQESPADGEFDYIQIQTPYDEKLNSTLMYAITFRYFTAKTEDSTILNVSGTDIEYTASWPQQKAKVYEVDIPDGTEEITVDFGQKVLAYNYSGDGNYISGSYDKDTMKKGVSSQKIEVDANDDGIYDYIQVQTPYDDSYNSDLLYVISFKGTSTENSGSGNTTQNIDADVLMENIAKSYVNEGGNGWIIMEMSAYAKYNPNTTYKTSADAKQSYINTVISTIDSGETAYGNISDTDIDKAIIALTSIGGDATKMYRVNDNTPISALEKLNSINKSTSAWCAPYTLAAYNQKEYATESYEESLINALLTAQKDEGCWDEYNMPIDSTANVITGLSFYKDRDDVSRAIEKGISYLSGQQKPSGAFDGGYGVNSNSTAMVVVALAAVGVNPDTDARFIKNGNSALDGLLSFALKDNSGFGYQDNTTLNMGATEQSFRALIAASQIMTTGDAYNIYDFSGNEVSPVRATGSGTIIKPEEPKGDNITVKFTIKADTGYWLNNYSVTIPGTGATVYHAFVKACEAAGITYVGAENGYVRSMTKAGRTLSEFTNGPDSGWMYKVNDVLVKVGLTSCGIKDGDDIVWFYTDDWKTVPGALDYMQTDQTVTTTGTAGSAITTTPTEVTVSGDTAKATIKTENTSEAIKQAKENKSAEIVIEVASADIKTAEKVQVEIPTAAAKEILNTTTADLTVKTPIATVTVPRDALKELVAEAKGTTIVVEVAAVSKPTDIQKKAAGTNGHIITVTIKAGNTVISTFGGKSLIIKAEVPAKLKGKKVAAIHIAADGTIEQLAGKLIKEGTKEFYEFMTTHLSTFALVDADEIGLEAKDEESNVERIKELVSDMSLKARSSKTSKKNIKVTLTVNKDTSAAIKEIEDMGYTVKYKYYRSTRKASKYASKLTSKKTSYTNTAGKKGTKYYYKARVQVYDKDGKLVAQTALKQCRYAARTWSK